jgi:hypothetical protein
VAVLIAARKFLAQDFLGEFFRTVDAQTFFVFPPLSSEPCTLRLLPYKWTLANLLSVNGFDRVLLDQTIQRVCIEPQTSTNLDRGQLPQPCLSVDGVHFQA